MLKQVLDIIDNEAINSISKGLDGDPKEMLKGSFYAGMEGVIEGLTIIGGVVSAVVAYNAIKAISKKELLLRAFLLFFRTQITKTNVIFVFGKFPGWDFHKKFPKRREELSYGVFYLFNSWIAYWVLDRVCDPLYFCRQGA